MQQANYAGSQVTSDGLEIEIAGAPTLVETSMVSADLANEINLIGDYSVNSIPIAFRQVQHAQSELKSLTDAITSDKAYWSSQGVGLSSWGPDVQSNTVKVWLTNYSDAAAAEIQTRYGSAVSVSSTSQSAFPSTSRYEDSDPWNGGDSIKKFVTSGGITTTTTCTSWFPGWFSPEPTASSGDYVVPTAGHCGSGEWTQNGTDLGPITHKVFSGSTDAEIISLQGSDSDENSFWADPVSPYNPSKATDLIVYRVATVDTVGLRVCNSGQTDENVCNVLIQSTGQTASYDGQSIGGLVKASQINGTPAFTPGDSGGPVWAPASVPASYNQYVYATAQGMIVANTGSPYSEGWYEPALTVCHYFKFHMFNPGLTPDPNC
ncbi:hypothetical protein [Frondihabitans sp. PAMC 28766]|uniref:hypothetical protein n=1 Tax=Frondihabitans sp. PAMC 28766 TaxID=1795630 RepID=UPI0012FF633D|nr:hypothetical protein [Frondihabitans sp. PAMC 28766]